MNIMVIDNHILFREGVVSLLNKQRDMDIVGECDVSYLAVQKAMEWNPDIILMDTGLLYADGLGLMKQILSQRPKISFIILTAQDSDERFYEMIKNGAKGYLPKNINKPILLASLRALDRGEAVIPRTLVAKVLGEFTRLGKLVSKNNSEKDLSLLTYRELEVLKILRTRATNREIAEQLVISVNTVRVHVRNILEKLNMRNRREASDFAKRVDLLEAGSAPSKGEYQFDGWKHSSI
ncbi:MAG: response regulator transcription factor [Chloroflexi bacterium]|nr:response regulator transcription factor [Chloroflexota bacterium]